jgi:tRNA G18 (ribose-2'-O)-methylase SpoU
MRKPEPISTLDDPRLHPYTGLRDHDLRQKRERRGGEFDGIFIAESVMVVERALAAGYEMVSMLLPWGRSDRVLPFTLPDDVPVYVAEGEVLARVTGLGMVRDLLAVLRRRPVPEAAEIIGSSRRLLVLERVVNPTTLGVIVRSAAGLGFDGLLMDPTCCDPLYRRASRSSMGEVFTMPYGWVPPFPRGLADVQEAGFTVVALTPDADAVPLASLRLEPGSKVALLLGSEGPGLTDKALSLADHRVRIPMHAGVDSLNVGAAAAIACYAVAAAVEG